MSFEIERKFLVRGNGWEKLATRRISLRQAYLACRREVRRMASFSQSLPRTRNFRSISKLIRSPRPGYDCNMRALDDDRQERIVTVS